MNRLYLPWRHATTTLHFPVHAVLIFEKLKKKILECSSDVLIRILKPVCSVTCFFIAYSPYQQELPICLTQRHTLTVQAQPQDLSQYRPYKLISSLLILDTLHKRLRLQRLHTVLSCFNRTDNVNNIVKKLYYHRNSVLQKVYRPFQREFSRQGYLVLYLSISSTLSFP